VPPSRDGVGGTPAGREASNAAVQTLSRILESVRSDEQQLRPAILDAVEEANKAVLGLARGAATTLVVAQLTAASLRCYHVGDSELLAVGQRGRIKQRVVPHSPTGFAVEAGLRDVAARCQCGSRVVQRDRITDMRVEIGPALQLCARDTVLLADDGLFDNLFIDEIVDSIRVDPPRSLDRLVERVRARMSGEGSADQPCKPDDRTVVLYRPGRNRRDALAASVDAAALSRPWLAVCAWPSRSAAARVLSCSYARAISSRNCCGNGLWPGDCRDPCRDPNT
jgi:serine/threonine protein phosphatase PrpC